MDNNDEFKKNLIRLEARCNIARDSYTAAIDFSNKTINFLFLLNGGAVTPIIIGKAESFYYLLFWFGLGACAAALTAALAYVLQMIICTTWNYEIYEDYKESPVTRWLTKHLNIFRFIQIIPAIASFVLFIVGLYKFIHHI